MRSQFTSRAFPEINISFLCRNDDISRRFECYLTESQMQHIFLPGNSLTFGKNFPSNEYSPLAMNNYLENALHMYVFFVI